MKTALAIFGWRRPEHLKKCLEAVKRNKKIDTFVFLDGGYLDSVYKIVEEFDPRLIFSNHEHWGLKKSIFKGIDIIFKKYDSVIVLEDDIVVADDFVQYILDGLKFYENKKDMGSITGYNYINATDIYAAGRFTCWGWGTWKDRWEKLNQNLEPLDAWGSDLPVMLDKATKGEIDTWDIQFQAAHNFYGWKCIHPPKSLVKNIGMDGSGTHFNLLSMLKPNKWKAEIHNVDYKFKYPLEIDEKIRLQFCKKNDISFIRKIINFLNTFKKSN